MRDVGVGHPVVVCPDVVVVAKTAEPQTRRGEFDGSENHGCPSHPDGLPSQKPLHNREDDAVRYPLLLGNLHTGTPLAVDVDDQPLQVGIHPGFGGLEGSAGDLFLRVPRPAAAERTPAGTSSASGRPSASALYAVMAGGRRVPAFGSATGTPDGVAVLGVPLVTATETLDVQMGVVPLDGTAVRTTLWRGLPAGEPLVRAPVTVQRENV